MVPDGFLANLQFLENEISGHVHITRTDFLESRHCCYIRHCITP
uniref:Uncharacterized protein n=1 Tax=Lepeophtheirus salmonis TaxID=72036 RepID=A0A0K2TG04_LEPSM